MAKLVWDQTGERLYETGIEDCILFVLGENGYGKGVAWNGVTGVDENPSGADPTKLWADNINYITLRSAEEFGATLRAYTYPDEFEACDGSATVGNGVVFRQQARKTFALAYKTRIGNDVDGDTHGYKWHIIYGLTASPSSKTYNTINDSPEAIEFSWELTSTPVKIEGYKPISTVEIDSTVIAAEKLTTIENSLYGTNGESGTDSTLLMPQEIVRLMQ